MVAEEVPTFTPASALRSVAVEPGAAYPAQLERVLRARGRDVEVVNAGIAGETSRGALARIDRDPARTLLGVLDGRAG